MKTGWILGAVGVASALSIGAVPATASPKEPLIVTQMADPDPYFAPGADPGHAVPNNNARIDEAMKNFGRAIGEATSVEQQQIEAKCRQGEADSTTREQRFAWAATCRYNRY